MPLEYVQSQRGNKLLLVNGYPFYRSQRNGGALGNKYS